MCTAGKVVRRGLEALIREHDRKYYVEAAPEISDLEYLGEMVDLILEKLG